MLIHCLKYLFMKTVLTQKHKLRINWNLNVCIAKKIHFHISLAGRVQSTRRELFLVRKLRIRKKM